MRVGLTIVGEDVQHVADGEQLLSVDGGQRRTRFGRGQQTASLPTSSQQASLSCALADHAPQRPLFPRQP